MFQISERVTVPDDLLNQSEREAFARFDRSLSCLESRSISIDLFGLETSGAELQKCNRDRSICGLLLYAWEMQKFPIEVIIHNDIADEPPYTKPMVSDPAKSLILSQPPLYRLRKL